jgi:arabinofuranosyltransferase
MTRTPAPDRRAHALPARADAALTAAIVATYVLLSWFLIWTYVPVDDAFIGFRYARNVASGLGPVFNPGERVEGYSSLSWVLILAAGERLGFSLPQLSKGLGLLLGAGTIVLLATSRFDRGPRLTAAALLAVHPAALYHFVNGLETSLAAFLVTALVCIEPGSALRTAVSHGIAAALVLTRPEGLLFVLLWCACGQFTDLRALRKDELRLALTALVAFGIQTAFRRAYYGDWIANSARAKLLPVDLALPRGLSDLLRFAVQGNGYGTILLLAVAGAVLGIASGVQRGKSKASGRKARPGRVASAGLTPATDDSGAIDESRRPLLRVLLFLGLSALLLAGSGGDSFPLWRFYVPIAPLFLLSATEGLGAVVRWAASRIGPARVAIHGMLALGLLAALVGSYPTHRRDMDRESMWVTSWEAIGRSLGQRFPPETSMALCPVGALPFYSAFTIVDMLGLNDSHISKVAPDRRYYYPGHHRHDGKYVLSRRPDLIMLANGPLSAVPDPTFPWNLVRIYERDILLDARFRREYLLIHVPVDGHRYVKLFASRDFARKHQSTPAADTK